MFEIGHQIVQSEVTRQLRSIDQFSGMGGIDSERFKVFVFQHLIGNGAEIMFMVAEINIVWRNGRLTRRRVVIIFLREEAVDRYAL